MAQKSLSGRGIPPVKFLFEALAPGGLHAVMWINSWFSASYILDKYDEMHRIFAGVPPTSDYVLMEELP
jgi:hypothetical protein